MNESHVFDLSVDALTHKEAQLERGNHHHGFLLGGSR